jgi:hypothetical protein
MYVTQMLHLDGIKKIFKNELTSFCNHLKIGGIAPALPTVPSLSS